MPTRTLITALMIFFIAMAVLKFGVTSAIDSLGAWIGIPIIAAFLIIAVLFDRSDKRKRERAND